MTSGFWSNVALVWIIGAAAFSTIQLLAFVGEQIEEWLRARRNLNKELPALAAQVEELRKSQSILEAQMKQLGRIRENGMATSLTVPHANGAGLPASASRL